ncbi:Uncharacterised protein [Vibrio metschnikovii]|uniref:hypothetical protein n=1 Tax=Vibrio metschnikovii TaxID=28172 RepID=UPI0001B957A6|nr:hypothetical protein [Vibrio metschnikovii]EEX35763.1 hypothetical protein VIB_002912 [Vibrio metschnikovii CIP 69.14]SUP07874.1 Uncharacterised protein [Vibrio metschnikovii]SUP47199.1 Uncharacterised protein [Vibrio metschnikovii]
MRVSKVWFLFFLLKFIFSLIVFYGLGNFIKLGDSYRYLNAGISFSFRVLYDSSFFLDFLGGVLSLLLGPLAAGGFALINFIFIYKALDGLFDNVQQLSFFLIILNFPSFILWTSVPSKEVFASGAILLIGSQVIRVYFNRCRIPKTWIVFSFYILLVFKPQFFPGVFVGYISALFYGRLNFGKWSFFLTSIFGWSFIILAMIYFSDLIGDTVLRVVRGFDLEAGASREPFWNSYSDWYMKAPEGMLLTVLGPTFQEARRNISVMIVFIESLALIFLLIFLFLRINIKIFKMEKVRLSVFSLTFYSFVLLLFSAYPFGVMNYGSAIRYRQDFMPYILVVLYCLAYLKPREK